VFSGSGPLRVTKNHRVAPEYFAGGEGRLPCHQIKVTYPICSRLNIFTFAECMRPVARGNRTCVFPEPTYQANFYVQMEAYIKFQRTRPGIQTSGSSFPLGVTKTSSPELFRHSSKALSSSVNDNEQCGILIHDIRSHGGNLQTLPYACPPSNPEAR